MTNIFKLKNIIIIIFVIIITISFKSQNASEIPEWIKTNAGWWATGQIDDETFAAGIEYLIKISLIVV